MFYLETKDIIKQYGEYRALNKVSIQVSQGCVYGLLGPNGAGKTTLIRIINRITAPDQGEVFFNGKLSAQNDIYNIGYLPEERGLYKKMEVQEQILFLSQLKGLSKKEAKIRMEHWLKKFDIESWAHKKVEELSKGMQQKIQFITTVIHEPQLLILDEPFSGFDPVNAELLKNEILELKASGKTIILSTHNMESVESLCDEISLINKSQVVLQGNVSDIRSSHKKNIFNIKIASESFSLDSSFISILSESTEKGITTLRVLKADDVSNAELLKPIIEKYEIISFEEELPSMNDIFIQTVTNKA